MIMCFLSNRKSDQPYSHVQAYTKQEVAVIKTILMLETPVLIFLSLHCSPSYRETVLSNKGHNHFVAIVFVQDCQTASDSERWLVDGQDIKRTLVHLQKGLCMYVCMRPATALSVHPIQCSKYGNQQKSVLVKMLLVVKNLNIDYEFC